MQQASSISPTIMDIVQLVVWLSAVLVALFGIRRGLHETQQNRSERVRQREHRQRELRWRKAQLGRDALRDLFTNSEAHDAMQMLDWSGRIYEVKPDQHQSITHEEMSTALRITHLEFSDKEAYVRDCFDELLDGLEMIEHYLRIDLIEFTDVRFPLEYYVRKLREFSGAVQPFIEQYGFSYAAALIERFDDAPA